MTNEKTPEIGTFSNEVFQAKYILPQKPAPRKDDPSMMTYISTYPALGQVSVVNSETITFTALLEVDESRASDAWEVSVWSSNGLEWKDTPLRRVNTSPTYLRSEQQAATHLYFKSVTAIELPRSFTVKFRATPEQSWKWAKDHQGSQDGNVVLKSTTAQSAISPSLKDYIEDLSPDFKSENHRSQSPGTTLWEVDAKVDAANGEKSTFRDLIFGVPWGRGKYLR